tara:strand:+ start:346 stop:729 length:384 start_codon:yes stop_codon:yes gene_type:complete
MLFFVTRMIVLTLIISFLDVFDKPLVAEGRMYEGTAEGPCIEWSNKRLKWPQTILGREKAKCRRRGKKPSKGTTTCRLKRTYIDVGTKQRICIFERAGTGLEDVTMSVDPSAGGACQKSYACDPIKN